MAATVERVVVAGFGAAGLAVARELRARGWSGELTVLGAERGLPYDRPPLSKAHLTAPEPAAVDLVAAEGLAELGLEWHEGVTAVGVDVAGRTVLDQTGAMHGYDALVVATGARPRTFGPESGLGHRVHVLRTLIDADRLRASLRTSSSLVVVGGGFLGFEVAASARSLGVETTVVEPLTNPLSDRLGGLLAQRVVELHLAHGVQVLTGRQVLAVTDATALSGPEVTLVDGTVLRADTVVVSIGAVPNTDWLQGSGLDLRGGLVCDAQLRAAPGIWAAGDVARWLHAGLGVTVRIEHRTNATEQGRAVAGDILGDRQPFTPTPFVWTDQYDARVQVAGWTPAHVAPSVAAGDPGGTSFVVEWRDERLHGVGGWNAAKVMMPWRRELLARQLDVRPEVLR